MNLAVTTALALSFLLAFSIGLNLGLHGALSFGDLRVLSGTAPNSDSQQKQPDTISAIPDTHSTELHINDPVTESHENELRSNVAESDHVPQSSLKVLNEIYEGKSVLDAITASALRSTKGEITTYLQNGGALPIVLLTCNRPDQLKKTLDSLLSVRGVTKDNLIVAQDGAVKAVAEVAKTNGLKLLQNVEGINLRGGAGGDGAERIAKHYKFSLSAAFNQMPLAPAIIIVEDDLLFSPDFYEYLAATAPVLETDPTTFVVSAWNDNGFNGRVSDVHALRRTEFFPGLGWLLPRKLYKNELEQQWPSQHWDHWLRSVEVHGTRDIVYPEVPRTYHNGIVGTFMNMETHNRYFRDVNYNTDKSVNWDVKTGTFLSSSTSHLPEGVPNYMTAVDSVDTARVEALIAQGTHLRNYQELFDNTGVLCLWIDIDPYEPNGGAPDFEPIALFFNIWHEHRRGAHRGLHEFHWEGSYVMIFNIRDVTGELNYKSKMPESAVLLNPSVFDKSGITEMRRKRLQLEGHPALSAGLSCNQVCEAKGLTCRADLLPLLNTCQALNEKFACKNCVKSFGMEQPAYVSTEAGGNDAGSCLISTEPDKSVCSSSHKNTYRLCACG